jgi:hypothetical protein
MVEGYRQKTLSVLHIKFNELVQFDFDVIHLKANNSKASSYINREFRSRTGKTQKAGRSNIHIIERYQCKVLRCLVNAPW